MAQATEKQSASAEQESSGSTKFVYDIEARDSGFRQDFGNTIHSKFGAANTSVYLDDRHMKQWKHFLGRQKFA